MAPSPAIGPDVVNLVDGLISNAIKDAASDLHLDPTPDGLVVRYRLDGVLSAVDRVPAAFAENVLARLKVLGGLLTYRIDIPQEGSFTFEGQDSSQVDMRLATFPTIHGERAVIRLFEDRESVRCLNQLGLSEAVEQALQRASEQTSGLVLITGPAGAGKSTTLYAIARHILSNSPGRCVVSLEDPVEQRVEGLSQIQVQPFGQLDYPTAMRSLLRQDVEVLIVGEIRDSQTAHIVIEAALTGHLILSTLHSGDPAETIARLLEMGIAPYQLTSTLRLVCSQRLVRSICPMCDGCGCDKCVMTGFKGRSACAQIAAMNDHLRQDVIETAPVKRLRQTIDEHHPSLFDCARALIQSGQTSAEEVRRVLGVDMSAPRAAFSPNGSGESDALV